MTSTHILQPSLIAANFSEKQESQDNLHAGQLFRWRALGQMPSSPASESVSTLVLSIHHQGIWMISTRLRRGWLCQHGVRCIFAMAPRSNCFPLTNLLSNVVNSPTASPTQMDGWLCLDVSRLQCAFLCAISHPNFTLLPYMTLPVLSLFVPSIPASQTYPLLEVLPPYLQSSPLQGIQPTRRPHLPVFPTIPVESVGRHITT